MRSRERSGGVKAEPVLSVLISVKVLAHGQVADFAPTVKAVDTQGGEGAKRITPLQGAGASQGQAWCSQDAPLRLGARREGGSVLRRDVGGEFGVEVGGDAGFEAGFAAVVVALEDLADLVEAGDGFGGFVGEGEFEVFADGLDFAAEGGEELVDAEAHLGGDGDSGVVHFEKAGDEFGGSLVDLIEDHEDGFVAGTDFLEDGFDGTDLFLGVVMAGVDDVEEEVGLDDFFEGGFEGFDQAVGELADEADGVGEEDVLVGGEAEAARGGIEGGEEFVFGEDGRAGEGVEESGFAGVGVADDGGEGPLLAETALALGGALAADEVEVFDDAVDAFLDFAAVGFELGFAFAAAHADAAFLAGEMAPVAGEAGEEVLELGELDLELAFAGAGALGKDIEDQGSAVENLALEDLFEIPALGGGEFVVEDDGIDLVLAAFVGEFGGLAGADEGTGVGGFEFLGAGAGDLAAGGGGEFGEFIEGIVDFPGGFALEFDTDEVDPLGALCGDID